MTNDITRKCERDFDIVKKSDKRLKIIKKRIDTMKDKCSRVIIRFLELVSEPNLGQAFDRG